MGALSGKVAVITGASSPNGIGRAIAKCFAQAGASMYLMAEGTETQLQQAVSECHTSSGQRGARFEYGLHDLAQAGAAEAMIDRAAQLFGRIDILVNNAAVSVRAKFGEFSRESFNQVVAVNLAAPFFASQAVVPIMRRQGSGRIIHIASQLGVVAHNRRALYGLTKAALIHLTKAMAYELAPDGIVVNAISPGPILTRDDGQETTRRPQTGTDRKSYMRLDRLGRPQEVADVALFLATGSPELLLGQNIIVDGGYTIH